MKLHSHARRGFARIIDERREYHVKYYVQEVSHGAPVRTQRDIILS